MQMADDYKLNVNLSDEREQKLRALEADDSDGLDGISDTVRGLIDDEFDRRDLELDLDTDEADDDSDEELYNPFDHDESLTLDRDLLRDVLREYDQPAIHPAHVSPTELPKSVAEKTQAVVAVARYRYLTEEGDPKWTPGNVSDLGREVQNVIGDADNRTVEKYREGAFGHINDDGGVGRPDNIRPSDVLNIDSVEEWVAETKREFVGRGDELPVAAIENRREMAAELWKWVAPHEGVQECLDELDIAIETAHDAEGESEEDAEENQSDDGDSDDRDTDDETDGEFADQLDALASAEEANEEDEDENQSATDDRSDDEKKYEAIKRKGGEPAEKK